MNHSPTRIVGSEERPRLRWVLGGSLVLALAWLGACSGGGSPSDQNSTQQNPPLSCSSPEVDCGGRCVNPASNALNCGACGNACGSGEICVNSFCEAGSCPTGTVMCAGACTDTQTSAANCGACGAACPAGQSCQAGGCVGGGTGGAGGAGGSSGGGGTGGGSGGSAGGSGGGTTGGSGGTDATGGTAGMDATGGTAGTGESGGSGGMDATGGTAGMDATGGTAGASAGSGGSGGQSTSDECRVWLAPDGNDSNAGTEAAPVATLLKAYDLVCPKPPDGTENGAECLGPAPRTICAKAGTYDVTERLEFKKTRMGTANNRIVFRGAPGGARPVFDFRNQERLSCGANPDNIGGFTVNAHYVTIRDIVVRGANDNCILVQGTEGLIENVLTYECADTGIQISAGGEYDLTGTNNTVRNCDSHSNYDVQCEGENADGFAIKEGTGTGNAFIGCRAWNNTDDGFDLYGWTSPVRIENSWAFDQCNTTDDTGSDCNGFKLGGDDVSAAHQLRDLYATGNTKKTGNGFTENSNPASMTCQGTCASWGNKVNVDSIGGVSTTPPGGANVTNMAADSARNADGSLKSISSL